MVTMTWLCSMVCWILYCSAWGETGGLLQVRTTGVNRFVLSVLRNPACMGGRSFVLMQMGFFTIVGLPMFKAMADVFEGAKPMLEGVMGNYRAWEAAAAAADAAPA